MYDPSLMAAGILTSIVSLIFSNPPFLSSLPSLVKIFPVHPQVGQAHCVCITPNGVCACCVTTPCPLQVLHVLSSVPFALINLSYATFLLVPRYHSSKVMLIAILISSPTVLFLRHLPPHPPNPHQKKLPMISHRSMSPPRPFGASPPHPPNPQKSNQPCHHPQNQPFLYASYCPLFFSSQRV